MVEKKMLKKNQQKNILEKNRMRKEMQIQCGKNEIVEKDIEIDKNIYINRQ